MRKKSRYPYCKKKEAMNEKRTVTKAVIDLLKKSNKELN